MLPLLSPIKCEKLIFNINEFPRNTKQRILKFSIINIWNTQVVHVLREERDSIFDFSVNLLSILPNTFGL